MSIIESQLVNLSENISYLKMPTNTGFIRAKNAAGASDIYLVDSGNDDTSGLKILDFIKENFPEDTLKAVINTHAHADHCGGNAILVEKTGCEVWASKGSASLMEYPSIETQLIWGGTPIHDIRSKFLLARPCHVTKTFSGGEIIKIPVLQSTSKCKKVQNPQQVEKSIEKTESKIQARKSGSNQNPQDENQSEKNITIEIIPLAGHYVDQTGFLFTDTDGKKIFFGGDAFTGKTAIKKFWIQYLLNENGTKDSLHKLSEIEADWYVPGHGEIVEEIEGIAELNLIAILETEDMILDELKTPKTHEEILKAVADRNSIPLKVSQYCLIGSTLRSYLAGLYENGKITYEIKDNKMFWKRA